MAKNHLSQRINKQNKKTSAEAVAFVQIEARFGDDSPRAKLRKLYESEPGSYIRDSRVDICALKSGSISIFHGPSTRLVFSLCVKLETALTEVRDLVSAIKGSSLRELIVRTSGDTDLLRQAIDILKEGLSTDSCVVAGSSAILRRGLIPIAPSDQERVSIQALFRAAGIPSSPNPSIKDIFSHLQVPFPMGVIENVASAGDASEVSLVVSSGLTTVALRSLGRDGKTPMAAIEIDGVMSPRIELFLKGIGARALTLQPVLTMAHRTPTSNAPDLGRGRWLTETLGPSHYHAIFQWETERAKDGKKPFGAHK